jgi:peptide/nickel transport system permease protein
MSSYLTGRVASVILSLLVASVIIFVIMEVLPGDPAQSILGMNERPDTLAALRAQLGLDAPPLIRYFSWIFGMLHADLGLSYTYRVPVSTLVLQRIGVSLPLAAISLTLTLLIAFPAGILAAAKRNSATDFSVMGLTQFGVAVPNFWFAIILVYVFAVILHWFSAGGFGGWDKGFWLGMRSLTLPAIALALPQAAILTRVMRSALLDTLEEDYVRTARAHGLSRNAALWRHALRNALIPVLTIVGLQFAFLMAGAIIIENVFFLPGLGRLVFQGITQRDLIVVKSVVMLLVFAVIMVNFLVDLSYLLVDPRLRRRA